MLVVIEDDAGNNSFLRTLFIPHLLHGGATVAHPNHAELGALIAILNGDRVSAAEGVADLRQQSSTVADVAHRGMLPKGMPFGVHTPDADGQFALLARFSRRSSIVYRTVRGQWKRSAYRQIQSAPESNQHYEGHSPHESMESQAEYRVTIELTSERTASPVRICCSLLCKAEVRGLRSDS